MTPRVLVFKVPFHAMHTLQDQAGRLRRGRSIHPYLVFVAFTIISYEGTGRSLFLKLVQQLCKITRPSLTIDATPLRSRRRLCVLPQEIRAQSTPEARTLREIKFLYMSTMPALSCPSHN